MKWERHVDEVIIRDRAAQATLKEEERAFIDKMGVFDVVDRASARGRQIIKTRWLLTNKGTVDAPNVRARWVAQEFKHMDGRDHSEHNAPTPGLDMVKAVLNHASAFKGGFGKGDDVIVAVVDTCRAYFYSNPRTTPTLSCQTTSTPGSVASSSGACMERARAWQRELEKEADLKIGEMSKCTFPSEVVRDDARG